MSFLARLEEACASFIERVFAKTFPSALQPAEVARKIAVAVETYALGERGADAPRSFIVRISPTDFQNLAPCHDELVEQWRALIEQLADTLAIPLNGRPEVHVISDAAAVLGTVSVEVEAPATHAPTPRVLALVVRRGLPAAARLSLERGGTIGRDSSCDLVLRDPRVSRRHARVDRRDDACEIVDLASRNGTVVDGRRVERATLAPGTRVELGDTLLIVEEAASGP